MAVAGAWGARERKHNASSSGLNTRERLSVSFGLLSNALQWNAPLHILVVVVYKHGGLIDPYAVHMSAIVKCACSTLKSE
jgi:hypothetical protein